MRKSLQKMQVDENYKDVIEFSDNAVIFEENVINSVNEKTVILKGNDKTSLLKPGDVFFAPDPKNPNITVAFKIVDVINSEDKITLSVCEPEFDEMYKKLDIQGIVRTGSPKSRSNATNFIGAGISHGDTFEIDASKLQFKGDYKIDAGDGDKIEVKLNGGLENPELEYRININGLTDFEFYVALNNTIKFHGEASVTMGHGKSGKLTLAEIPVPICAGITAKIYVDLVVQADGIVTVEYSLQNTVGLSVDSEEGLQLKKDFKKPEINPKAEINATVGISPGIELNAFSFIAGVNAEVGANISAKASLLKDKKVHSDISAYLYFNARIYSDGNLKSFLEFFKLGTEEEFEIINKDNSPVKGDLHLENLDLVDKCTYRYVKGKISKVSGIPIDGVTVEIYRNSNDKSPICTVTSNDFGEFGTLISYDGTDYPDNLIFKFVKDGYKTIEKSFNVKVGEDTDIGAIEMETSSGEGQEENRVYFDDFSLVIPSNWIYKEFDRYVYFYEESIYNKAVDLGYKDAMGTIVLIERFDNKDDIDNIPIRHQLVGYNEDIYYVGVYPSDCKIPYELAQTDPDLFNSLTEKLYQERDKSVEVFKTFELYN